MWNRHARKKCPKRLFPYGCSQDFVALLGPVDTCRNHKTPVFVTVQALSDYSGARVLILGGGDGAILRQLMELPAGARVGRVTMVELDERVMSACSRHMPAVCGDYLEEDNRGRSGGHCQVVVGDAFTYMEQLEVGYAI